MRNFNPIRWYLERQTKKQAKQASEKFFMAQKTLMECSQEIKKLREETGAKNVEMFIDKMQKKGNKNVK